MKIMSTFASQTKKQRLPTAKIAQLVEHDLAKVGVAGSSPVFRSNPLKARKGQMKMSRWRNW